MFHFFLSVFFSLLFPFFFNSFLIFVIFIK
jgi:hypothetical protein